MTRLLEKAFEQAAQLPDELQDDFAAFVLEELGSERRWNQALEQSQEELGRLADEALDERQAGSTERLDPERL